MHSRASAPFLTPAFEGPGVLSVSSKSSPKWRALLTRSRRLCGVSALVIASAWVYVPANVEFRSRHQLWLFVIEVRIGGARKWKAFAVR